MVPASGVNSTVRSTTTRTPRQRPDRTEREVREKIQAFQFRIQLPAVDKSAGYGKAVGMRVFMDGNGERRVESWGTPTSARAVVALHDPPTVILPTDAGGLKVDILSGSLADIRNPELVGHPIETTAPRIAQTVGPDLVVADCANERIVAGDGVETIGGGAKVDS